MANFVHAERFCVHAENAATCMPVVHIAQVVAVHFIDALLCLSKQIMHGLRQHTAQ